MGVVGRRTLLAAGAAGAAAALSGCASPRELRRLDYTPITTPPPVPEPGTPVTAPPPIERVPLDGSPLYGLPGEGNLMAWTLDDGADGEVIRRYLGLSERSGVRLTMFVTGSYPGWADNEAGIAEGLKWGRVQLANHTWSHPDLTRLRNAEIGDELMRTHDDMAARFGVDLRPYFRPPFGRFDQRVLRAAADVGYTQPVLWYGSIADSGPIDAPTLLDYAGQWFLPQHIVIGHLNVPTATTVFPELLQLLTDRGLRTVTLDDVFLR